MAGILDIRVQKLFVVILILKVLSSGLGWYFGFPWSLGFWIPLVLMVAYIILGLKRHDSDVTDEKFADTCYYLGFIFTITSIIFSLLELPSIGTKIQDIAVRFGAAMVSTVPVSYTHLDVYKRQPCACEVKAPASWQLE